MTSAELRAELCELYAERTRREKITLDEIRRHGAISDQARLWAIDTSIANTEKLIAALEAKTPADMRIVDAEMLVKFAIEDNQSIRSRHAEALAEVEKADAALDTAVEAAKQVIAKVAEERPELRGKVGETGCFQIARSIEYSATYGNQSIVNAWRNIVSEYAAENDLDAMRNALNAVSIKPAFITKHIDRFKGEVIATENTTIKFVKSAFGKERSNV
jgi:hypothetical protein